MQQEELRTPVGKINMYRNGQRINFEVEEFDYGIYVNDTLKRPQGLYGLYPNIDEMKKDDIIICEFDGGSMEYDGGDEYMTNIVGVYQGYTIGMGVPDSQDIEDHYTQRERVLPYETWGSTGKGFEIHIIDSPLKYPRDNDFYKVFFIVAWEPGTTNEAWEMVSFVTC